ncbi:unnamed protein product [Dovyalis caffra]|uniref:Uncharacterized protein n=1 Tax=Dovyalis caffra TaxID=77055 RepID=A0AAV1S727_9ROSI|nr:unnamed protein product [Dovyalis caffra]
MNEVTSLQDLNPTLVDGAPLDLSQEDVPNLEGQASASFNSPLMQDNELPKGGDYQPEMFDENIYLSFSEDEDGNIICGISDFSVANAPNLPPLDFEPPSFSNPSMGAATSAFPAVQEHVEPGLLDEPCLNHANSGQSMVQSACSAFDPLSGNSTNAGQTRSSLVNPALPIPTQVYSPVKMEMIPQNVMMPPFSMENDVNWTPNQFNSQAQDTFPSELLLPPPVVPVNQSSMLCNAQVGQNMVDNNVINNSIQHTTQFPTSFPQTMTPMGILDGTSSWINQNEPNWLLPNQNTPSEYIMYQPNQMMAANVFDLQCTNPMLPGSSMPLRHQQLSNQFLLSNQVPGMLPGPQPSMNQRPQQLPYQFNQVPVTTNVYDPQGSMIMLPESSPTLWFQQIPPRNLQVSGEHDVLNSQYNNSMLFGPTASSRHQNSFTHQPQPGQVYMTPNATTSQHGRGFNQPETSLIAPWIQYFSNQGQVNKAAVMPNIDNMQQENLVPWNFGNSTWSQTDNLQVQGLLNQSNASNFGLDTSLQSQIMGLYTQQQNKGKSTEVVSHHPDTVSLLNNRNENMILGSRSHGNSHYEIGESSSAKRPRTESTLSTEDQESLDVFSCDSGQAKSAIYDPLFEGIGLQVDPHLRMLALL